MKPSCHIIIVNYNAGDWLARALGSALKHSGAAITVVDNASTDDSVRHAQQLYPSDIDGGRIDWLLNTQNLGFAAANNQVLASLEQDYAVLMNPDCELESDTLKAIFDAFHVNSDMGIASCRIIDDNGDLQASCRRRFPTPWSALVRMLKLGRLFPNNPKFADFDYGSSVDESAEIEFVEAISGAFMVVSKRALSQVGLLDEGYFMHCEDLDWCKRFELAGLKVGFVPRVSIMHAKGISSRSRPVAVLWTLHKGMDRFFNKFYRNDYSWPIRVTVKIGIYLSFASRAVITMFAGART